MKVDNNYTTKDQVESIVYRLKKSFDSGITRPIEYRLQQLRALSTLIHENKDVIVKSMEDDFKSHHDALMEVLAVQSEVVNAINKLSTWVKDTKYSTSLAFITDDCFLRHQPRGVSLIIAPWNYPVDLLFEPLIGAISAGCPAVMKPSEISISTMKTLTELIPKYLDNNCYAVVTGGPSETGWLLDWPHWGLIFFTGSGSVGKIVQERAAKNLIPTILELGGKSPCIVTPSVLTDGYYLETVAKRIIYGKLFNAGQTCVAPDYVILTDNSCVEKFVEALQKAIKSFYGDDPCATESYSRIVNSNHFERLEKSLQKCEGDVINVGNSNKNEKRFAPTIVIKPSLNSNLMKQEIFGPILPIITTENLSSALRYVNSGDTPLALYIFSHDSDEIQQVLDTTGSGSVCVNDTMMQTFTGFLPLGGFNASGMGRYKGKWSFEAFSHPKPVMWRSLRGEIINDMTRNPPINDKKITALSYAAFNTPRKCHLNK